MLDHDFNLKNSRHYQLTFIIIFITSVIIPFCLPMNFTWKLLFLCLLMGYGIYLLFHAGIFANKHSIIRIRRSQEGEWMLYTPTEMMFATLDQNTTVTRYVSILCFRLEHSFAFKSCVIFSDALPPNHYRRLLVLLKLGS